MAVRCQSCRQPLPVRPGQSAQHLRCPWCGVEQGGPAPLATTSAVAIATAARPQTAVATSATPAAPGSPPPAPPRSRSSALAGGTTSLSVWISGATSALVVVLFGLLLIWYFFPRRAEPSDPTVVQNLTDPATLDHSPSAALEEDDRVTRPLKGRTAPSGGLLGIRPRDNRGVIPWKPGDEIALPRIVKFMGSQASGRRICIIADCSGSMKMNGRIEQLKEELEKTLRDLAAEQQFYVIFFDHKPEPMPEKNWLSGGADVEKVLPWLRGQSPRGGTLPMGAFEIAFRLEPRPDLIFFMTDGIIPHDVPAKVASLNSNSPKTPINTILFGGEFPFRSARAKMKGKGNTLGEDLLKKLAADSGGNYRFVADKGAE